jgi:hypothetical protein
MGFFIVDSTDTYTWQNPKTRRTDGFIRLHFVQPTCVNHCVADWDFLIADGKLVFVDMKADNDELNKTTFRYDAPKG